MVLLTPVEVQARSMINESLQHSNVTLHKHQIARLKKKLSLRNANRIAYCVHSKYFN